MGTYPLIRRFYDRRKRSQALGFATTYIGNPREDISYTDMLAFISDCEYCMKMTMMKRSSK